MPTKAYVLLFSKLKLIFFNTSFSSVYLKLTSFNTILFLNNSLVDFSFLIGAFNIWFILSIDTFFSFASVIKNGSCFIFDIILLIRTIYAVISPIDILLLKTSINAINGHIILGIQKSILCKVCEKCIIHALLYSLSNISFILFSIFAIKTEDKL